MVKENFSRKLFFTTLFVLILISCGHRKYDHTYMSKSMINIDNKINLKNDTSQLQFNFNSKSISKSTMKIVNKIEEINQLMSSAVYISGTRPKQYDNFVQLKKKVTARELIELTNHPNGVVRCYALWALSYNNNVDLFPIIVKHINDYELINTQFGCAGFEQMAGDFFINVVTPEYIDLKSNKFDSTAFEKLDSILIYSDSKLDAKDDAIERAKPTEKLYPEIKKMVKENSNQSAVIALAKYKKQDDIQLIIDNMDKNKYETYKAIREFPDDKFLPLLESHLNKAVDKVSSNYFWRELYNAIASFRNEESSDLFEIHLKSDKIKKDHIDLTYRALRIYKCDSYTQLLWRLWEEDNCISTDVYKYLLEKDSVRVLENTKKTLLEPDRLKLIKRGYDWDLDSEDKVLSVMLYFLAQKDYETLVEVVQTRIMDADVLTFPFFADMVTETKSPSFVEPLLKRFESEGNPHVYLKIIKVLLSYNDKTINERISQTIIINNQLTQGWGGDSLKELLRNNGLKIK